MPRASNLLIVVMLVSGAARSEPLPKVQQQPSSMTPGQAMQMNGLSPELPRTEVLPFDAAVSRALRRNPSATVAMEEVTRARAIVEQVRSASLPTLGANASYTRLEHDRVLAGTNTVIAPADQLNANLALTVPLVAPSRWLQWSHAKDNVDVARMNAEDVRRQLALSTARTYLEIIAQHHVIEVSQRARDSARAHYQFAHQRFVGVYGTRIDEVRAAQEVAADESQLQTSVANLARLRETLGVLVGIEHPIDVTEDVTLPGAPTL
ncbi:MAG: outer rane efflux protein [bacterium]|nr:outer rane efflux protein [bacterium]